MAAGVFLLINTSPHACFQRFQALRVTMEGTHSSFPQHTVFLASLLTLSRFAEGDATLKFNRAFEKSLVRLPCCAMAHTSPHLAPLRSAHRHRSLASGSTRHSILLANQLSITLVIKIDLRMCFPQISVINLALLPKKHSPPLSKPEHVDSMNVYVSTDCTDEEENTTRLASIL